MKLIPFKVYLARFRGKDNCPAWDDYRVCQSLLTFPTVPGLNHLFRLKELNDINIMDENYWIAMESGAENFDVICIVPDYCLELTVALQAESVLQQINNIQKLIHKKERVST